MVYRIFIRHCQTRVDPLAPPANWKLNEVGKIQANMLVKIFEENNWKPDIVYTSTERKTVQSMKPLIRSQNLTHKTDKAFDELHFAHYIKSQDEFLLQRRNQLSDLDYSYMGGETASQSLDRFEKVIKKLPISKNSVICSHGTVLALYLSTIKGLNEKQRYHFWENMEFGHIWFVKNGIIKKEIKNVV